MDFRNWFDITHQVDDIIKNIRNKALSSIQRIDNNSVGFKFPKPLASSAQINFAQPARSSSFLAAHTENPGNLLGEGIGHGDPYGKGTVALKSLKRIQDPNWTPNEELKFKRTLKNKIARIGTHIGLLFELEVFDQLVSLGLKNEETHDIFWLESEKNKVLSLIEGVAGKSVSLVLDMVKTHASHLAPQMLSSAQKNLNCRPNRIKFYGGINGPTDSSYDIIISCNNNKDAAPYSLKFTSETRIRLADLSYVNGYELLGGKSPKTFNKDLNTFTNPKEMIDFTLETLTTLANELDPKSFTEILNYLLSRNDKTMPVFRNYVTGMGNVGWAKKISKDFDIVNNKLKPKKEAQISIRTNPTYVAITYKVDGGTTHGTQLYVEPMQEKIRFRVNNFVSD